MTFPKFVIFLGVVVTSLGALGHFHYQGTETRIKIDRTQFEGQPYISPGYVYEEHFSLPQRVSLAMFVFGIMITLSGISISISWRRAIVDTAQESATLAILLSQQKQTNAILKTYVGNISTAINEIAAKIRNTGVTGTQWLSSDAPIPNMIKTKTGNIVESLLIGLDNEIRQDTGQDVRCNNQQTIPAASPSVSDRLGEIEDQETAIQQRLVAWRQQNAPTGDLERYKLLSTWQADWKTGRDKVEYLPLFESYEKYEQLLRSAVK